MAIDWESRMLRDEIAQLETDNLELQGQVQTLNATIALVQMTLAKIAINLETV